MIEAIDGIVSLDPFVVRRRVVFQDCDPAGVVFSGNFYDYVLWAYHLYLERRLRPVGEPITAPMKAASFVHHAPLYPGDAVDFRIRPLRVGGSTFTLAVEGRSDDRPIFDAELTLICRASDAWKSCPVPPGIRAMLQQDGAAQAQQVIEGEGR